MICESVMTGLPPGLCLADDGSIVRPDGTPAPAPVIAAITAVDKARETAAPRPGRTTDFLKTDQGMILAAGAAALLLVLVMRR